MNANRKLNHTQREFNDNSKERQTELIEQYKNESGKLPVCNAKIEIKT